MNRKGKNYISFILNLIIVILVLTSVCDLYYNGVVGNMVATGRDSFRYFTIDSNILLGISSLCTMFSIVFKKNLKWVTVLKLFGVTSVALTFLVVVLFLGRVLGYEMMFDGANIYLHAVNPLLGVLTFTLFDPKKEIGIRENILSLIPVILYGIVYGFMVFVRKRWEDFYSLNSGVLEGKWYLSFLVLLIMTFTISLVIGKAYRKK